jgi:hypothetical protein
LLRVEHEDGSVAVYHAAGCIYGGDDHDGPCLPPVIPLEIERGRPGQPGENGSDGTGLAGSHIVRSLPSPPPVGEMRLEGDDIVKPWRLKGPAR